MIVIPMAGLSKRFADAGYDRPKYMLQLAGKSVFAHAVSSFAQYFDAEPFLFIARDVQGTQDFIKAEARAIGIADARVVILPSITAGQGDTVRQGILQAEMTSDEPLTIFNIDTFRPGFHYPRADWMRSADGYLEVMPGSDPGYSFVLPSDEGQDRVARTSEKQPISSWASTGLYWFRRCGEFLHAFDRCEAHENGEIYVAPMYNDLISRGLDVRYQVVGEHEVIFCGTPVQYENLLSSSHSETFSHYEVVHPRSSYLNPSRTSREEPR